MTDLDPESRRILELARAARTPSEEDKARVQRRFAVALGLSATTASVGPAAHGAKGATAATAAGIASFKWWLGGGALLSAGLASYLALSAPSLKTARSVSRLDARVAATTPPTAPTAALESPPARRLAAPTNAAPMPERTARHLEHQRSNPRGESLAAELDLLHRAQAAWRAREAGSALALLDEHRTRYPHSMLGPERDALQVLTLCELARKDEATRLAHSVLARAPHSPLRASLEQSCALK
jgi:hypothetical protein